MKPPQDILDRIAGKTMVELQGKVSGMVTDAFIKIRKQTGISLFDEATADELVMAIESLCWGAHLIGVAEGQRKALDEATEIAEKRSTELMTVYQMHNGQPDIRGGCAAGEVALLIQQYKELLGFTEYECCGSTTPHYHSVTCPKAR
jgi:hypothetical protein